MQGSVIFQVVKQFVWH